MTMTDPIADMLTRIRNAAAIRRESVDIPQSKIKKEIARVLLREGFVDNVKDLADVPRGGVRIYLKYAPDGTNIIRRIRRISTPGRRVYRSSTDLRPVLNGLGIAIVSTPLGVLSDRECRKRNVGGEILCELW
jgi:small subunit ribosomal protein S8